MRPGSEGSGPPVLGAIEGGCEPSDPLLNRNRHAFAQCLRVRAAARRHGAFADPGRAPIPGFAAKKRSYSSFGTTGRRNARLPHGAVSSHQVRKPAGKPASEEGSGGDEYDRLLATNCLFGCARPGVPCQRRLSSGKGDACGFFFEVLHMGRCMKARLRFLSTYCLITGLLVVRRRHGFRFLRSHKLLMGRNTQHIDEKPAFPYAALHEGMADSRWRHPPPHG